MEKTLTTQIAECIEKTFNLGGKNMSNKIIVFPCGDVGIQLVNIMREIYSINPAWIIDNNKCKYNPAIKQSSFLETIDSKDYVLILASTNPYIYHELKKIVAEQFVSGTIIEFECMKRPFEKKYTTDIGKYSFGPICIDHPFIKSIGAFCSFAEGVAYVTQHEMKYITTHPMIYCGKNYHGFEVPYDTYSREKWYFPGVEPQANKTTKQSRAVIGNDVWLGKNVTVINSCNIGNGVIAGAGAVITKDVPDYAIVVGVPARILKFRYNPAQIEALNRIEWWNWTDDQIVERYNDFYLSIDAFIQKYDK